MEGMLPGIMDIAYEGRWIIIVRHKTFFEIVAKKQERVIATIEWYARWRKWIFVPRTDTVWDNECLGDICGFLGTLPKK